jgi:hypothetical protein
MKFCFFKRLASALEETMSVARPHLGKPESLLIGSRKSSPAVDGATAAQTLGQCNKPIERPIYMCFSPLRRKTSELEGEEYNEAKQSCRWNVPELRTT